MHTRTRARTDTHTHTHIHTHTHTHIHTHACRHTCMQTHTRIQAHKYILILAQCLAQDNALVVLVVSRYGCECVCTQNEHGIWGPFTIDPSNLGQSGVTHNLSDGALQPHLQDGSKVHCIIYPWRKCHTIPHHTHLKCRVSMVASPKFETLLHSSIFYVLRILLHRATQSRTHVL